MKISFVNDGLAKRVYSDKYGLSWIPCQLRDRFYERKRGLWTVCIHDNKWTNRDVDEIERSIKKYSQLIVSVEQLIKGKEKRLTMLERIFALKEKLWLFSIRRTVKKRYWG